MNIDVIREETPLPVLTTGDHVVLHPVGAYNITQAMQFITYRPAVVMIGTNGKVHVIRRRENLDHVQALEEMPAHLAPHGLHVVPRNDAGTVLNGRSRS
jgi:diaminopimelate decarboxylase